MPKPSPSRLLAVLFAVPVLLAADPALTPLVVVAPDHPAAVDFDREILPLLQGSCLPCHNKTTTKAELILETPADMLKGGESGPALVPGKSGESLLFKLSSHQAKPRMPPKENKVNAVNLQPGELGLLALWIDQGAHPSERHHVDIAWQPLAPTVQSVYSAALTDDGRYAVCGRGNQLFVFDTDDSRPLARLDDPALASSGPPAAHHDVVNSVAISSDGAWIASGGYREIKLWQLRSDEPKDNGKPTDTGPVTNAFPSQPLAAPDGKHLLRFTTNHLLELTLKDGTAPIALVPRAISPLTDPARLRQIAQSDLEFAQSRAEAAGKEMEAQTARVTKSAIAAKTARDAGETTLRAETQARMESSIAAAVLARLEKSKASAETQKPVRERLDKANKAVEAAAAESAKTELKISSAGEEERLAEVSLRKASTLLLVAQRRVTEATSRRASFPTPGPPSDTAWSTPPSAAVWSSDNRWCAVAFPGAIHVWSGITGAWIASTRPDHPVSALGFDVRKRLQWRNPGTGQDRSWPFLPHWELAHTLGTGDDRSPLIDRVNALAFRADGRRLASGSGEPTRGSEIRVWDPTTGGQLYAFTNLHSDTILALAFSPDGTRLASGGADRFARVVDLATGRQVVALEGHTGHVLAVSWRADGRVLATGGADNVIKFWNLMTGERGKTVSGFSKEITGLAHVGTGGDIVAASGEPELRRVTEGGDKPSSFAGAHDFQHTAAATPDGRWIIAGGQDGIVRLWEVSSGKLVREFAPEMPGMVAR